MHDHEFVVIIDDFVSIRQRRLAAASEEELILH